MQNNGPTRIGNKSAICAECPAVKPTGEGKQAAITEGANAPTHRFRFNLGRVQTDQRKLSRPEQPVNQNGAGSHSVTPNSEQCATPDDAKRKQGFPRAATPDKADRDNNTHMAVTSEDMIMSDVLHGAV